jgi:hypothetical protein
MLSINVIGGNARMLMKTGQLRQVWSTSWMTLLTTGYTDQTLKSSYDMQVEAPTRECFARVIMSCLTEYTATGILDNEARQRP